MVELSSEGEDGSRILPVCPASIVLRRLDSGDESPASPSSSLLGAVLARFPRHHHQKSQSRSPLSSSLLVAVFEPDFCSICATFDLLPLIAEFLDINGDCASNTQAASSARQRMLVCRAEEFGDSWLLLGSNCEAVEVLQ